MIDINSGEGRGPECVDALRLMYLFLDKELSAEERLHVQEHLDACIPCLEQFEFEVELKRVIACKCQDEVPDHLYERVRATLQLEIQGGTLASANAPLLADPSAQPGRIGENPSESGIPKA